MLARWAPQNGETKRTSASLVPTVDTLFDEAFTLFRQPYAHTWAMPPNHGADIAETENEFLVSVDLPGYDPKSLQVKLEADTLTIQAERKPGPNSYVRNERHSGVFARSFVLPNTIDNSKCQASLEHGVLTVTLPKREEAKPRVIDIKVQS